METDRLYFRKLDDNDFGNIKAIICDPITMKFYPKPYDESGVIRWINWNKDCYNKYGFGLFAVILKETNEFIGDCGITLQNINGNQVFEIGYHFNKKFWKHGYCIEAARFMKDYFFKNTNNDEVYSYMNIENVDSINVAKRNDMDYVMTYKDGNETLVVYKITRKKWEAVKHD